LVLDEELGDETVEALVLALQLRDALIDIGMASMVTMG